MYIDTHCHITFSDFDPDRATVIGNAKKAGVQKFIVPGVDSLSNSLVRQLAATQRGSIYAAIGHHPYEAQNLPDVFLLEKELDDTVVAIGECGLDYHLYKNEEAKSKKTNQIRLFDEQIKLANKYNLPVTMHCRDAFDDFFTVLDNQPKMPKGVIHCFSGGLQEVRMAKDRGLYIGVDGNLTYSKQLQTILPNIPLDMILLETDAPYLTPIPHRRKRNEPKYIPIIATEIARLTGKSTDEVEEITTRNAREVFPRITP